MSEISELAKDLGISEAQLERLRRKYQYEHGEEAEEKLGVWLKATFEQVRGRRWLLSRHPSSSVVDEHGHRHYGYTESPSEAMAENEEGVPPYEIEHYRESRQARIRFAEEQAAEVENLLGAMTELRAAINAMPRDTQRRCGRSFWILRSRLDAAERDLKRRMAA